MPVGGVSGDFHAGGQQLRLQRDADERLGAVDWQHQCAVDDDRDRPARGRRSAASAGSRSRVARAARGSAPSTTSSPRTRRTTARTGNITVGGVVGDLHPGGQQLRLQRHADERLGAVHWQHQRAVDDDGHEPARGRRSAASAGSRSPAARAARGSAPSTISSPRIRARPRGPATSRSAASW